MNDTDLLETAVNFSNNAIILGTSLRNSEGEIDDFKIQLVNQRAEEITGLSKQILVGMPIRSAFTNNSLSIVWEQAIDVFETGTAREVDSLLSLKSGETRFYTVALRPYADGIYITFTDVSLHRQTIEGLQKTVDELKRSNQNLEQFAYVASHDLQEPLRKIIAFSEVLQEKYSGHLDESGIDLVDRMRQASHRMLGLIKNLLSFSRIVSQKTPFKRINLQEVVNEVISDLEPVIQEKRAVLDVTSLPYMEGDASQLAQLFQNLLSNALKFTRPGDLPLIRIDCEVILGRAIQPMPGTSVLSTDLNRSFFAISVIDNGIGFDEKYLDRIFTIFQRLHNRNDYPGTGIGLAVVQRVIDNHKGYLNARSQPGKGAEFIVYLPDEPALLDLGI